MLRFSSTSFFVFDNLQIKTIYLRSLAHYLTWLQMHLSHSATWFLFSGPPPCVASSRCPWAACSPPWCHWCPSAGSCCRVTISASKSSIRRSVITEKAPTRAFSWLKCLLPLSHLRQYAKRALTPRSLNVKLGPRRNYHKEWAALRHYANQTAQPLW